MGTNTNKDAILAVLAAVGAFLANALGGWDALLKLLTALMIADYLTGSAVALIFKKSGKSESGAYDAHYVRAAIILFFIGNEGISLLENVGLMGVKYPQFLKNTLEALRDKGDGGKGDAKQS